MRFVKGETARKGVREKGLTLRFVLRVKTLVCVKERFVLVIREAKKLTCFRKVRSLRKSLKGR